MEADGVIGRYAIAGAVAAYNYIEPAVTDDLDILVSFREARHQAASGLITLAPKGVVIADWPVQFLPIARSPS